MSSRRSTTWSISDRRAATRAAGSSPAARRRRSQPTAPRTPVVTCATDSRARGPRRSPLRAGARADPAVISVTVIRLAAQDHEAAVELLEHEDANQAVRDGEPAERDQPAGLAAEGVAVAVGPADREGDRDAAA